ncbi:MAG: hypothetical protein JNK59_04540 [Sterolibacteriaceae bacterium]|uniref:hypothetical protein n=1 Tax=Sulfuritalea sp. TaxID=2480090 RepID=UPI001A368EE9|nr:hypothetical protein [Sulfuritalea sp.]MBL8478555.1 hypothetical protein [Sterolibacteriaceae bacterium]MBN8474298.1 hypothetical protein [Sulfuritalea sp.]
MMTTYLTAIAVIFSLALGGILIDRAYRRFAARNPLLGPFRDPGKCGCCSAGSGCASACDAEPAASAMKHR